MDRSLISPSISSEERNSAILNNDTASQLHTADSASGSGHRSQSTQPSAFINVDVFATTQSTTPIIDSPSIALSSEKVKPSTKKSNVQKTKRNGKTGNNRGERMNFELDEVIRNYTPEQFKTCQAYDVGGVNILNKKPVDSKTTLDKIKRRRETHNRVERRRRDRINQLIDELIALLPKEEMDLFKSHRADVLRATVAHIQSLNHQNTNLKHQIELIHAGKPIPPPAIITALAPIMDINENNEFTDDEYSKIDGDNDDSRSFKSGVSSPISYSSHEQIAHSSLPNPERLSLYPYSDEQEGEESSSDIGWKNSSSAHVTPLSDGPYSPGTPSVGIPVIVEPPVTEIAEASACTAAHSSTLAPKSVPTRARFQQPLRRCMGMAVEQVHILLAFQIMILPHPIRLIRRTHNIHHIHRIHLMGQVQHMRTFPSHLS
ncbi:hypothetical protein BGZ76_007324 [Entomortierella beljakovae]|nr:hypothetical protein BGZ76_007324 [Entomortierella beljakovae]